MKYLFNTKDLLGRTEDVLDLTKGKRAKAQRKMDEILASWIKEAEKLGLKILSSSTHIPQPAANPYSVSGRYLFMWITAAEA